MKLLILHYHLKKGGVTKIIESQLTHLSEHNRITLATSDATALIKIPSTVKYRQLTELEYLTSEDPQKWERLKTSLKNKISQLLEPGMIIHAHNHHLGKNPLLTLVLYELAVAGVPVLYHIHDFPEDNRPENYTLLRKVIESHFRRPLAEVLYPGYQNVSYALINDRDYQIVKKATGHAYVHLLPNPIEEAEASDKIDTEALRKQLDIPTGKAVITYPVRPIRRKNLGEFILLAALFPTYRFMTTLEPQNPMENRIYRKWKSFAHQADIAITWEAGEKITFDEVMALSDSIVSTSMAEGFGMVFLESWLFNRSFSGRDLPQITQNFRDNGIELKRTWASLHIPAEAVNLSKLRSAWKKYLTQMYLTYDIPIDPASISSIIKGKIENGSGWIDFIDLDREFQEMVILKIKEDPELVKKIVRKNHLKKLIDLDPKSEQNTKVLKNNRRLIRTHYNGKKYSGRLKKVYERLSGKYRHTDVPLRRENRVLKEFMDPQQIHLIRG